jgi:YkoY family integral membrane protein
MGGPMLLEYTWEPSDLGIFLTLILLEGVLSFDNAAVLAAMVRKLPLEQRKKALLYGLAGAYAFRILAILFVAFIIANPLLKVVGGGYLLYLAYKHLLAKRPHGEHVEQGFFARIGVSGFWGIVLAVELADAAFALDQILVAVAMTEKIPLIIAASLIAILFLRLSAAYMTALMDWFPALEKLAYVAVGFVGLKLVAVEAAHYAGFVDFEVPKAVSIGVTLSLLVVPVVGKALWERFGKPQPAAQANADAPAPSDAPPAKDGPGRPEAER